MRGWRRVIAAPLVLATVAGCYGIRVSPGGAERVAYRSIPRPNVTPDDLDVGGLKRAAHASRTYFRNGRVRGRYVLGGDVYSAEQIASSIDRFVDLVENTPPRLLHQRIARECRGYSPARGARFTAYFEPVLEARLEPDPRFRYPIYREPDDLTLVRLSRFFPNGPAAAGRGGELMPYLTRAEIDGRRLLAGRGLELAYVDDPVALYFLHVQGSGRLRLPDGRVLRVNYAGSNGLPYASIGRYMLDRGLIDRGSATAIREYLNALPEPERNAILFRNPRYIFFREVALDHDEGPIGSLGVPLVAGRSIAADTRYVPPGAVVYIKTRAPVLDTRGHLVGWNDMARFTFHHDSGAAIKGPGRADIYWGEGDRAGMAAGYVNAPGDMVVLVCGVEPHGHSTARRHANGMVSVSWPEVERALAAVDVP